ncbi:hypothetical protein [Actinacidiphila sp. ITFR-21]|uniref:hypothetical protein n=1 Tax=Actinacidiphila sp. ITFR-21 TaxID=3075199 RepID=UPI00288B0F4E|nr:hypothetical protein [Streptomyces sp. ITFR-21]WNI19197.1 hypothetical protein RLT57_29080 [Streptomyces sp. ITFR-21]
MSDQPTRIGTGAEQTPHRPPAPPQPSTVIQQPATPEACARDYQQGHAARRAFDTHARRFYADR